MGQIHAERYRPPAVPMKDFAWQAVLEWVVVASIVVAVYAFIPITA